MGAVARLLTHTSRRRSRIPYGALVICSAKGSSIITLALAMVLIWVHCCSVRTLLVMRFVDQDVFEQSRDFSELCNVDFVVCRSQVCRVPSRVRPSQSPSTSSPAHDWVHRREVPLPRSGRCSHRCHLRHGCWSPSPLRPSRRSLRLRLRLSGCGDG